MIDKEKEKKEIAETLQTAVGKSAEYFREEMKKAFANGATRFGSKDRQKSLYDFQAELLVNAGYGNIENAVREFANKCINYDSCFDLCKDYIYDIFYDMFGENL